MEEYYSKTKIMQNLKDAGCADEEIQRFINDVEQEKISDGMKLLQQHRRCLLDCMHEWQKKIDCLDYLIYRMKEKR